MFTIMQVLNIDITTMLICTVTVKDKLKRKYKVFVSEMRKYVTIKKSFSISYHFSKMLLSLFRYSL